MHIKKGCLFFLIIALAECRKDHGPYTNRLKKDASTNIKKRAMGREVFENLFQLYDPSFLAVVWPKISNGVHLTLESSCWEDISVLFKDFSEGKTWAFRGKCFVICKFPQVFFLINNFNN